MSYINTGQEWIKMTWIVSKMGLKLKLHWDKNGLDRGFCRAGTVTGLDLGMWCDLGLWLWWGLRWVGMGLNVGFVPRDAVGLTRWRSAGREDTWRGQEAERHSKY